MNSSPKSKWERHHIEERVRQILSDVAYTETTHHFGRPFLTAYQLAIEFDRRFPEIVQDLEMQIGGVGTGENFTLAAYLAGQLSTRIKNLTTQGIEGRFISKKDLREMIFADQKGNAIRPSMMENQYDLSMFRLRE